MKIMQFMNINFCVIQSNKRNFKVKELKDTSTIAVTVKIVDPDNSGKTKNITVDTRTLAHERIYLCVNTKYPPRTLLQKVTGTR